MAEIDNAGMLDTGASPDTQLKTFTPDELLTCDVCLRANPPTRTGCLYCGAPLTPAATIISEEAGYCPPIRIATTGGQ